MNRQTDNRYPSGDRSNGFIAIAMAMVLFVLSAADVMGQTAVRRGHRLHQPAPAANVDSTATGQGTPAATVPEALPDSIPAKAAMTDRETVTVEDFIILSSDSVYVTEADTTVILTAGEAYEADSLRRSARNAAIMKRLSDIPEDEWVPRDIEFNPDPNRAVWLSALFPGLGQIYNRRYWKLPIIVGGYLGLGYATSWNNQMLTEYTRAYSDLLDNDPSSNSYMDFFAPNVKESDIDKSWLQNLLRSRKNYFRRNRDLCIIGMVGVYLLAMVDAYVDASLSHFDINPHLSMDVVPTLMQDGRQKYPSVGLAWALNF